MLTRHQKTLIDTAFEAQQVLGLDHRQMLILLSLVPVSYDVAYNYHLNKLCQTKGLDFTPPK